MIVIGLFVVWLGFIICLVDGSCGLVDWVIEEGELFDVGEVYELGIVFEIFCWVVWCCNEYIIFILLFGFLFWLG